LTKTQNLTINKSMKTYLFATAVVAAAQQLQNSGKPFSAYDVTKTLRSSVNSGDIHFSDRTTEDVDGVDTYRVEHNEVKRIFTDAYSAGVFGTLGRTWDNSGNGFWSYRGASGTPVYGSPTPTIAKPLPTQPQTNLEQKIVSYLHRQGIGSTVTMKRIQSRLKGYPVSCKDLASVLPKLGFKVSGSDCYSKYLVHV
jgi:hypothetical protein